MLTINEIIKLRELMSKTSHVQAEELSKEFNDISIDKLEIEAENLYHIVSDLKLTNESIKDLSIYENIYEKFEFLYFYKNREDFNKLNLCECIESSFGVKSKIEFYTEIINAQ